MHYKWTMHGGLGLQITIRINSRHEHLQPLSFLTQHSISSTASPSDVHTICAFPLVSSPPLRLPLGEGIRLPRSDCTVHAELLLFPQLGEAKEGEKQGSPKLPVFD